MLLAGAGTLLGACTSQSRRGANVERIRIGPGRGAFDLPAGRGHEQHRITVHCYRPHGFTARSPILLVLPGAGRNGDEYRDAWADHAEDAGVLVASPSYPEAAYDSAAYQMGGLIVNLVRGEPLAGSTSTSIYLRDEDLRFDVNPHRAEWLFNDFDRLFALLTRATGSRQRGYDMFGHSAGAQILHRHVLFCPRSRARRIVAANSGFYTLPDLESPLPVGMAGLGIDAASLRRSFSHQLTLLLGEADNHPDRGGIHLHTPSIDRQGKDRLSRGRYFHAFGAERALAMNARFNWSLQVVPKIGHDFRAMSRAAAKLLYG